MHMSSNGETWRHNALEKSVEGSDGTIYDTYSELAESNNINH